MDLISKVMFLLFNTLSGFAIAFLPKSKCPLISWLQSPSAVILEPKKIKSLTFSIFFPPICHEVMGLDAMILVFWMFNIKSTSTGSSKKQVSSKTKKIYFCLIDYAKPLTVWITINCGKFWKRWEYQTTWPASWEIYMQVRKQQLELDMERQTGSK